MIMKQKKRVYISGKIGEEILSDETIAKFKNAEELLEKNGWVARNPTCKLYQEFLNKHLKCEKRAHLIFKDRGFDRYKSALLYDFIHISDCDAIYMLKDWEESPGATAEYYFAKACGKEIILEKDYIDNV